METFAADHQGQIFSPNCQTEPSELGAHFYETKTLEHEFLQMQFSQEKFKKMYWKKSPPMNIALYEYKST